MTTIYAMSLTFNDLDDLLADIAPLAFDGDIGFIGDKWGGDWSKTYANLDSDIDSKELATLIVIPDNPGRRMRDAIANGKGDTDEQHLAWTILNRLVIGENEEPLHLSLEAGLHVYLDPVRLWISDPLAREAR